MSYSRYWCRRSAVLLASLVWGCGDAREPAPVATPVPTAVTLSVDAGDASEASSRADFFEGYLHEVVEGNVEDARAAYQRAAAGAQGEWSARAALRQAELAASAGQSREALELVARVEGIARDDDAVAARVNRLWSRLASDEQGVQIRGPAAGVALPGVGNKPQPGLPLPRNRCAPISVVLSGRALSC